MATIDFTGVQGDMARLKAFQDQLAITTDPGARAVLQGEISGLQAAVAAELQHAQAQADATAASMNSLQLMSIFQGLGNTVVSSIPTIVTLFK